MSKNLTITIIILASMVLLGALGMSFYEKSFLKIPEVSLENQKKETKILPEEAIAEYQADFSFEGPETVEINQGLPLTLKLELEETPEDKGIIGIKLVLKFTPSENLSLSADKIQTRLPKPWQFLRQEISEEGEINLEAVYLQQGNKGYVNPQEQTLAILNFDIIQKGEVEFILDSQKSELRAKENNLKILFKNDVYYNCEVTP